MFYQLIRPFLFSLHPETAHHLGIAAMAHLGRVLPPPSAPECNPVTLMGLNFPNRIGLAAGLDKNAEAIDGFARLGFGHIEVGTVTPRAQPGNPKPRMFRLPEAQAIINRMGFNNEGVEALILAVQRARYRGVLGVNIGKNFDTPIERAKDDYLYCFEKVYAHASYVTVNISSPNTANLRQLQGAGELDVLLGSLKEAQARLADQHGRHVPLVLKIAPDLEPVQIEAIAKALVQHAVEGVIATNTTLSREKVKGLPHADEAGGLSGSPVFERSTQVLADLVRHLDGALPVIAAGGVMSAAQAREKLQAGAQLVQIYTGLIYRGPGLIRQSIAACESFSPGGETR